MLLALTHLRTLWRKKDDFLDVKVEEGERGAKKLGQCWKLMWWKATIWVHWTPCHSGWFVPKYRKMYFFRSVPTERRNSAYKVHIQSNFRGWSMKNTRVSVRGMRHLLYMHGLDVRLKCVGSPSTGTRRGQKRNRSDQHGLRRLFLLRHLCQFHFKKGVQQVILRKSFCLESRPRSHSEKGFPIRKCLWEASRKVREGNYKNGPFGAFGPRPKVFHI